MAETTTFLLREQASAVAHAAKVAKWTHVVPAIFAPGAAKHMPSDAT
jgi:hypothetical protein